MRHAFYALFNANATKTILYARHHHYTAPPPALTTCINIHTVIRFGRWTRQSVNGKDIELVMLLLLLLYSTIIIIIFIVTFAVIAKHFMHTQTQTNMNEWAFM